jgi:choice-of-anchor B domain-containing protein
MKNAKSILILLFLVCSSISISQTSFNMYLLKALDEHNHPNGYSIGCWGYTQNSREYGILACNGGTSFIDITDSANIHEVDFLNANFFSNWRDFKIYQHWIYIVNDLSGGIQIADLQYLPDSIHFVKYYSYPGFFRAHTIEQSGPYLFLNGGNYLSGGVVVLDLSNDPLNPVKRGQWETQYVHDERIRNDTLWCSNIYVGTISVLDARNKDSLKLITSFNAGINPAPHNSDITGNGKYLFTTDEILTAPVGKLKIWDIQDVMNPVYLTSWSPAGCDSANVHNIDFYGNLAVISHYTAGLRVLDVSNPIAPVEIAWYDTYPRNNGTSWEGCKGSYMFPASGKIIVNDKQTGFYCLKIGIPSIGIGSNSTSIPNEISLKQNYPNPFNPATNIEFNLPRNEIVTVKIYDVTGKEVMTLLNGQTRAGSNKLTVDASNLPAGSISIHLRREILRIQKNDFGKIARIQL